MIGAHLDPLLMLLIADHVGQELRVFLYPQVLLRQLAYFELIGGKLAYCLAVHRNQD